MPVRMNASLLRGFERYSVPLLDAINQRPPLKNRLQATIGKFSALWMTEVSSQLWRIDGVEHLERIDAPRGIILAANHRSFFDLYICSAYLVNHHPRLIERLFFPVRGEYFYTHPLGVVINLALSGGSMWPPVFRDDRRRELNAVGMEQIVEAMQRGSIIGLHPEGRRGDGDPYELLPAKRGLGDLIHASHPDTLVLPYFTFGLPNSFKELVRRNYSPAGSRGDIVSLRFGAPLRAADVREGRSPIEATSHVMDHIRALGELDREMRRVTGGKA